MKLEDKQVSMQDTVLSMPTTMQAYNAHRHFLVACTMHKACITLHRRETCSHARNACERALQRCFRSLSIAASFFAGDLANLAVGSSGVCKKCSGLAHHTTARLLCYILGAMENIRRLENKTKKAWFSH